jgi:nucleotide-binding universal stress UspA family protein
VGIIPEADGIIPEADHPATRGLIMNEIVVGIDLSPSARAALGWAAEQSRANGQSLLAVHAVDVSPAFNLELGMGRAAVPIDAAAMDGTYRRAIEAVFDSVGREPGWRLSFFSGEPGPVLVTESVGAALLVVGTRARAGSGRLISGSVSHYGLSHADCPVVAVPARDHGADQDHDHAAVDTPAAT